MNALGVIAIVLAVVSVLIVYSCCAVAGQADEQAEREAMKAAQEQNETE